MTIDFEPIPGPRALPLVGNLFDLPSDQPPIQGLEHLADVYGEIYGINITGQGSLCVSSAEIMNEILSDDKTWVKPAIPNLARKGRPLGLVAAATADPDWGQSHRVLMPAFGPIAIQSMFDGMKDIANQLVLKWARMGHKEEILLTDDYTKLTLDIIAANTMDYRFNSFYRDDMHPFVQAMMNRLNAATDKAMQPAIVTKAMALFGSVDKSADDVQTMVDIAQEIITERRENPVDKDDLLNHMLHGKDPKTGESMRDALIASEMISFLIAGHETTSGLLAFATLFLLQSPEAYRKVQAEVDQVVGRGPIEDRHLKQFKYIDAALREALRLAPTAPRIAKVIAKEKQNELVTLGGKYKIDPQQVVTILLAKAMSDPRVFGDDAKEFKPERMHESNPDYERLSQYFKPFSSGMRGCLGRSFAFQEAVLTIALIFQNFDLELADPDYKLHIEHRVTIKPVNLRVRATLRHGMTPIELDRRLHATAYEAHDPAHKHDNGVKSSVERPITILFGSNAGTCQALARMLATEAVSEHGFTADVKPLDASVARLPRDRPVVILTSSYEGEPPENAVHFVDWLKSVQGKQLEGVKYAVFGAGHRDWHTTYHKIPLLVDQLMKQGGAEPLTQIGLTDVANGNNSRADFETWLDTHFWPSLRTKQEVTLARAASFKEIEAELSTSERTATLQQDLQIGTVKAVDTLVVDGEPLKKHMSIELPSGTTYECGDYLAILPQSPEPIVREILAHFKLTADATITLKSSAFKPLPLNTPLSVAEVLRNYYELSHPATKRGIAYCLQSTEDAATHNALFRLFDDPVLFAQKITKTRKSMFNLLKEHPAIDLPFPTFLTLLPQLSIRQYSIASSPLHQPDRCTISYSVISHQPASVTDPAFHGTATTFLSHLRPHDLIHVSVRKTAKREFRLPIDPATTPLVMLCAGTGLAPFRGFIEQRSYQLKADSCLKLAPAHLFIGCRSSTRDRLYGKDLDRWAAEGVVTLHYSFSREPESSEGCKYVSDRMKKEKDILDQMWHENARWYVCGNRAFLEDIRRVTEEMASDAAARSPTLERISGYDGARLTMEKEKDRILESIKERAANDVFD